MPVKKNHRPQIQLREERLRHEWSQRHLAELLGTTEVTINRWENGVTAPSPFYRLKLCDLFDMSAEALGFFTTSPQTPDEVKTESVASAEHLLSSSLDASCVWGVPSPRNLFFIGREAILQRMHEVLRPQKTRGLTQSWALSGLGGIGKTQTAIEYAYRSMQDYTAIFWVTAETPESLLASFVTIAELLNIPEQLKQQQDRMVAAIHHWLINHHGWLLIVDNVENPAVMKPFLPSAQQGSLLFTSRRQTLGIVAQTGELDSLTLDEGMRFLLHRAKLLDPRNSLEYLPQQEVVSARKIVTVMDGLPLALDQAGAYIAETGCDLTHYDALYQTSHMILLNRRGHCEEDHPHSVVTTFSFSFQQVEARNPAAADLLRFCAFMSPEAIPEELFLCKTEMPSESGDSLALSALELDEILALLRCYSLIKRHVATSELSIHRIVQVILKAQMEPHLYHQWALRAIEIINRGFPEVNAFTTWSRCQRLLPHALAGITLIEEEHLVSEDAGRVLHQTGVYLLEHAQYSQAEAYLVQAHAIRVHLYGREHVQVAESLGYLAELAYHKGQYPQAEQLHLQALTIQQKQVGPLHPAIATSLNNLAGIYWIRGHWEQAMPLYQHALEIREEMLGREHLDVGETVQNIAYLLFEQEHYEEAEPLYLRTLAIYHQVLGTNHAYLIPLLNNLGRLYQAQGKYGDANVQYLQATSLCEHVLDPQHPYHALTLRNRAGLASAQGENSQAEAWYRQTLHFREQMLGHEHPRTAQSQYDLAVFYHEQGQEDKAIHLYQHALAVQVKALGPAHRDTAQTRMRYQQLLTQMA